MQALPFAASGTRESNAALKSSAWHQQVAPGDALSIAHRLAAPQSGQVDRLNGARLNFSRHLSLHYRLCGKLSLAPFNSEN